MNLEEDFGRQLRFNALGKLLDGLRRDAVFLVLLGVLVLLSTLAPQKIIAYPSLVDWPTIAALTGLLTLTKALERSGALDRAGHWLTGRMATERGVALCLVLTAAMLSTVLTNDVALFVVVPLTLGVCRLTGLPATRLIILEALAVNAGSALTPIGNPQNLFLWQLSGVSFVEFTATMLPLVLVLMGVLLGLTYCLFTQRAIGLGDEDHSSTLDSGLMWVSLALYVPFVLATDLRYAGIAALVVLLIFLIFRRHVLAQVDWGLLLVFVLMFIDLRLVAGLAFVRDGMQTLGLEQARHLYFAAIGASQIISNVPAAIALAEYSNNWRVIAYGVNAGGFGLVVGSMANLIALRMSGDRRAWLEFHWYAIPFLGVAAACGYVLLF
ncbi:SLC13 family permease [Actimicrobium antarcticum]|uniref:Anion transporter n=1 Tax=Actimicrobium antarcticum TaxID=1051899 RepID=A0ABP7SWQ3_9BURK